jgi:hypothetical protein
LLNALNSTAPESGPPGRDPYCDGNDELRFSRRFEDDKVVEGEDGDEGDSEMSDWSDYVSMAVER